MLTRRVAVCTALLAVLASACSSASGNAARGDRDRGLTDAPIRGDVETEPLIGDLALCAHYRRALEARGVETETFDGDVAALAGLKALFGRRVA